MKVTIVGLGYVGLPTAVAFHEVGFEVTGVDISKNVIRKLRNGESPISDSTENLEIPVKSKRWQVFQDFSCIETADLVLVTVPTPTTDTNEPDLSHVYSAFRSIFSNLNKKKETIIVLESTVSPGTTRMVSNAVSEEFGLTLGFDCHVCYSPERVSPGDGKTVRNVSRIIGSDDEKIGERVASTYRKITSEVCKLVSSIEVAESAKMVENVQRDIDIAFTNELANFFPRMGIDVEEVLEAAETKWSFHRHYPGIGVGGHCIPVDPYYYIDVSANLERPSLIAPIARKINEEMPIESAKQIIRILGGKAGGKKVLVLGYSYKPNLGDTRMTPVLRLSEELFSEGMEIIIYDPHVDSSLFPDFAKFTENPEALKEVDIIVLATAHSECLDLDWNRLLENTTTRTIFDGRRALRRSDMLRLGWNYTGVGVP